MEMKSNLDIYNKVSITPNEARKEISAGRLKGMTDINPMWRIKTLTEVFGICGIGWKYIITSKRLEAGCKGQISAFVDVELFIKHNDVWSEAIPGTGGASFVTDEKNGLYQSDECFKMALTDALSVSCKALGMSADIYYSKDKSKYDSLQSSTSIPTQQSQPSQWLNKGTEAYNKVVEALTNGGYTIEQVKTKYKLSKEIEDYLKKINK